MQNKYYFPIHLNSNNRGCEAIARGTIKVLELSRNNYVGLSTNINIDKMFELEKISNLVAGKNPHIILRIISKMKRFINHSNDYTESYKLRYGGFLNIIGNDDFCMITGGDMFCYGDNELNYIINNMENKGVPTVLWGCSFGEENLTPAKLKALNQLSLITARESLTYNYFVNILKLKNVYLVADPAFTLLPEKVNLPKCFQNDVIGINLSNFTSEKYSDDNVFFKSFLKFIEYIIDNTNLNIVLIPHVFWKGQDDRTVCRLVKEKSTNTGRIFILNSEKMNYCQIRYAISKCRFFIGARTHAMISAYSTCTPSIALGYSIKSKGIAKDLGIDNRLVIDYRKVKSTEELIECFEYMVQNEEQIRINLQSIIPEYTTKAYLARDAIEIFSKCIKENDK